MAQVIVTAAVNDVERAEVQGRHGPRDAAVASDGRTTSPWMGATRWRAPGMSRHEAFRAAQSSFSGELAAAARRAGMIPSTVVVYVKK